MFIVFLPSSIALSDYGHAYYWRVASTSTAASTSNIIVDNDDDVSATRTMTVDANDDGATVYVAEKFVHRPCVTPLARS